MVTFKAVVLSHQKRADDSYNVKIRVTHKRQSKYISTSLTALKTDLTRTLTIKNNSSLMFQCTKEIEKMASIVSNIGYADLEDMEVSDVVSYINNNMKTQGGFRLDFFEFADKALCGKSEGTRKTYVTALNSFERFLGVRKCDINRITRSMVMEYMEFLKTEPKQVHGVKGKRVASDKAKRVAMNNYVNKLSSLFNDAKDIYNDEDADINNIPKSPFKKVKRERCIHHGQEPLTREEMQMMISYDGPMTPKQREALDIFLLSFALMGMNLADIYEAKYTKGKELVYKRKKARTRRLDEAEIHVLIPKCVAPIAARLAEGNNGWLVDHRDGDGYTFSCNKTKILHYLSKRILGKNFTMYTARHTFATLARNECGYEKSRVDDCLNHVNHDDKLADVYIKKDWSRVQEVQKDVISLFSW